MPSSSSVLTSLYTYGQDSGTPPKVEHSSNILTGESYKVWNRTSGYKGKKARHEQLPNNPFSDRKFTKRVPTQTIWVFRPENPTNRVMEWGCWGVPNYFNPTLPNAVSLELHNECMQKMAGRLNGTQFSVPLFAKDFNQTVRMFHKTANDIYTWFLTHRATFLRKKGFLENSWLEYRMGWRLLLMDIMDALKAVHDRRQQGLITKVRVRARRGWSWKQTYLYGQIPAFTTGLSYSDTLDEVEAEYETVITLRVRDTAYKNLQSLQQFGITNPASFLWDAIPLSFVLDWMFSVGDYLRTLDCFVGRELCSGTESYVAQYSRSFKPVNVRPYGTWVVGSTDLTSGQLFERVYTRVSLDTFPASSLPQIQVNLNKERVLDGLALLKQLSPLIYKPKG